MADDCCKTPSALEIIATVPDGVVPTMPDGSRLTRLRIAQMDCPTEEALIRKRLGSMDEVQSLEFNLMQRVLTVVHTDDTLPAIQAAIRELGMESENLEGASAKTSDDTVEAKPWWPLAVGGAAAVTAEIIHWAGLPEWAAALLALSAIAISGIDTYRRGWIALRHGNLNINALMSIAVTGALLLRQWPEAAMVMVLFSIAELIEAKSIDRARNAIRSLVQLAPEHATVGGWVVD